MTDKKNGVQLITDERARQILELGHTSERDDRYSREELSLAAACYASPIRLYKRHNYGDGSVLHDDPFPWGPESDMRPDPRPGFTKTQTREERIELLAKAGALIAAEIDRHLRALEKEK